MVLKPARLLPTGFMPLALAGCLSIAAAGVHERVLERGNRAPRQRTRLRARKIAYASRSSNAVASPQGTESE
jgi:hypothetical protein